MNSYDSSPKNLRIFFSLVLEDIIPHNPTESRSDKIENNLTDEEWKEDFCDSVESQLKALLEPLDYQVAYDRKTAVRSFRKKNRSYLIPFLVSKVHEFNADNIIIPRPGYSGFKVKESALSWIQETFAKDILDTLSTHVEVYELTFNMVTSRSFTFEIFYEGNFKLKREFTDEHIKSEGGIRASLKLFFDEVASEIEPLGFQITSMPSTHKRSRNNEYLFGISYEQCIVFGENNVYGDGCYAVRGDASTDEINEHGIGFEDTLVDQTNAILELELSINLPPDADLISSEIHYIDDSEETFDVDDELIFLQK